MTEDERKRRNDSSRIRSRRRRADRRLELWRTGQITDAEYEFRVAMSDLAHDMSPDSR